MHLRQLSGRHRLVLWFGLSAAPVAWATQLVAGYAIEEAACSTKTDLWLGVEPWIVLLTVTLAALAALGGVAAWWSLRRVRLGRTDDPRGRLRFMAAVGLGASILFLAGIVLAGLPVVTLNECSP